MIVEVIKSVSSDYVYMSVCNRCVKITGIKDNNGTPGSNRYWGEIISSRNVNENVGDKCVIYGLYIGHDDKLSTWNILTEKDLIS